MRISSSSKFLPAAIAPAILTILFSTCISATNARAEGFRANWESLKAELAELQGVEYQTAEAERADKCGMPVVLQYQGMRDQFNRTPRRVVTTLLARPELPLYYDSPTGFFRIHYAVSGSDAVFQPNVDSHGALNAGAADGVPDYVNAVADIFDSVMTTILSDSLSGGLGYPVPPSDTLTATDTAGQYDIYLPNVGGAYFGLTAPEGSIANFFNNNPGWSSASFIILDNDYQEAPFQSVAQRSGIRYSRYPLEAVRVTAAHEFFHAIHFGIDNTEGPAPFGLVQPYWQEMSSVAMEELLYDHVNDYLGYLYSGLSSTPFKTPFRSIQTFSSSAPDADFPYAMGIFGMFLNDKEGLGPHFTRRVWEGCGAAGPDFLRALDSALLAQSSGAYDLNDAYAEFGLQLFFTGERFHLAPDSSMRFEEGEGYPMIPDTLNDTNFFPVNYTFVGGVPNKPEANSVSFTFFKDIYRTLGVLGDCFKSLVNVTDAPTVLAGIDTRVTLIGVPRDPMAQAVVVTSRNSDPVVLVDDTITVTGPEKDSALLWYREQYPCEVQDTTSPGRVRMLDNRPSAFLPQPFDYEQAVMLVTKTTPNWANYRNSDLLKTIATYPFQYRVRDTSNRPLSFVEQPYGLLSAFPNPAEPTDQEIVLRAGRDTLDFPQLGTEVTIAVAIFTEAGEKVYEGEDSGRFDQINFIWPLTNLSGAPVASGVYIVLQQLITPGGAVSSSETTKVLVIR